MACKEAGSPPLLNEDCNRQTNPFVIFPHFIRGKEDATATITHPSSSSTTEPKRLFLLVRLISWLLPVPPLVVEVEEEEEEDGAFAPFLFPSFLLPFLSSFHLHFYVRYFFAARGGGMDGCCTAQTDGSKRTSCATNRKRGETEKISSARISLLLRFFAVVM